MARSFDPQAEAAKDPFAPIPVGKYAARVSDLEKKQGRKDDYLNTELTVLAGPFETHPVGVKSPYYERKVWDILSYSDGALPRLGQAFIAVGHPQPPRDLDDMQEMRDEVFFGRVVVIEVFHEQDYKDATQMRAKVRKWIPAGAEILAKHPHRPPVKGGAPAAAPSSGGAGPIPGQPYDDDDIPF